MKLAEPFFQTIKKNAVGWILSLLALVFHFMHTHEVNSSYQKILQTIVVMDKMQHLNLTDIKQKLPAAFSINQQNGQIQFIEYHKKTLLIFDDCFERYDFQKETFINYCW
ncbi:hypothetical protein [Conchiformibius kuhniae]|uniref:Uncharacterized protein n=1 Tax=Conchiformibius kuhniae TaxID=211502 RepID=A0A8T9MYM3_9NEIS|nr:hypothetical protein [Conchiformibius kuhniae]UOP05588.1 hypothetical protein LVJ77_05690 [Conchiformibius kuhniae]